MIPIVDTHQHLWDLTRFRLPWLAGVPALNRSFLVADFREASRDAHVVRAVYMEVDVDPAQRVAEAQEILRICQRPGSITVGAVIGGDPRDPELGAYLDRFRGQPAVKGLRRVLHTPETPRGTCLAPDFLAGIRELGRRDLSFDLCLRPAELADGAALARACPETRFVLDHCGNADPYVVSGEALPQPGEPFAHDGRQWMDDVRALGELPNVICKISGIVARARPGWSAADLAPTVDHCLDAFGPDRVVFGGDWPVCTLGASYLAWTEALREIIAPRSPDAQRKLLHDNAMAFYRLT